MRDFHKPGRSPIYASDGAAATSHPLATAAAIACLKEGGTAMDAAITASTVLAVVEPAMTGIGGDCFVLLSKGGSDDIIAYNGNGAAPLRAEVGYFQKQGLTEIAPDSIHAVTIPGAIDAWNRLAIHHVNLDDPTRSPVLLQKEVSMHCMCSSWVHPLGLRDVYEIRRLNGPDVRITGTGGVTDWKSAAEMVLCGADLVGICAETLVSGFGFLPGLVKEFKRWFGSRSLLPCTK